MDTVVSPWQVSRSSSSFLSVAGPGPLDPLDPAAFTQLEPFTIPSSPSLSPNPSLDFDPVPKSFTITQSMENMNLQSYSPRISMPMNHHAERASPPLFSSTMGTNDWAASLSVPPSNDNEYEPEPYDFPAHNVATMAPVSLVTSARANSTSTSISPQPGMFAPPSCNWNEDASSSSHPLESMPSNSSMARNEGGSTGSASGSASGSTGRSKRRVRMYTEATRARHREVQREFIKRKKHKMEQNKVLLRLLERQIQWLSAHSEVLELQRERYSVIQQSLSAAVAMDTVAMQGFLQDQVDRVADAFTPLRVIDLHQLQRETLDGLTWQQQQSQQLSTEWQSVDTQDLDWRLHVHQESSDRGCGFVLVRDLQGQREALVEKVWTHCTASCVEPGWLTGPSTLVKRRVLQILPANDTSIVCSATYDQVAQRISCHLELIMRVQHSHKSLMVLRRLELPGLESLIDRTDDWRQQLVWFEFSSVSTTTPNEGLCAVRWQGYVPSSECPSTSLFQELLFRAMRFQTAIASVSPFAVDATPSSRST